jgi:hypothetical protein
MKKFLALLSASGIAAVLASGAAQAQSYPASVVGTWTILANNTQPFTLTVQAQSSDAPCAQITGVLGATNDTLLGYYCPTTGAVSFERNSSQTGVTFQVYTGSLSWGSGTPQMTGSFANYDDVDNNGNDVGAYSFAATRPPS